MEQELFDFSEILNKRKNSLYYPRIADDILKKKLDTFGAVYITGPKWCRRTHTAEPFKTIYPYDLSCIFSAVLFAIRDKYS